MTIGRAASHGAYALASAVGLAALSYPLWAPAPAGGPGIAPLALALLVGLCLAALALEASSGGLGARRVAALGVLVAITSALRFVEVAVPGPGGFSPVFLLFILSGYVFGPRFGFLLGSVTMAVSAVVTGGVSPWLPAQMLVAGWVGLSAGWLPHPVETRSVSRRTLAMLASFGAAWGLLYGLLLTPWTWLYYDTGLALEASTGTAGRFAAFYLATSLAWDATRALGNVALVLVAAPAVVPALHRLGRWFDFERSDGAGGRLVTHRPPGTLHPYPRAARALPARIDGGLPPAGWVLWVAAVAVVATVTRNPLVLVAAWLAVMAVEAALGDRGTRPPISTGRLAAVVLPVSALYGLLALHAGNHVLLRLPATWPLVGGPLTLEGMVFGACGGLALVVLYAAFGAFQRAVGTRGLVRLVPRAFAALGLVSAIALTQLPALRRQAAAVREAWLVRGAEPRGLEAWRALAVPLLVGGLERSLQTAESLVVRGLVPAEDGTPPTVRLAVPVGLAMAAAGWVAATVGWLPSHAGLFLTASGALLAAIALRRLAGRSRTTDYRGFAWSAGAALVVAASIVPLLVLTMPEARASAAWTPFPRLAYPGVDPALALSILFLAAPVLVLRREAPPGLPAGRARLVGPAAPGGTKAARTTDDRPIVALRGFTYRYPGTDQAALEGLSLELPRGGITLVTGDSGAGKSTFLRALVGLVPHFTGGTVSGAISVAGADPVRLGPTAMAWRVGYVAGDPESTFVMDTVGDEVAYALEQRGVAPDEIRHRVAAALGDVGLADAADRALGTLSGGERQRVAIAAAMAGVPSLLLLDEPTSQLDDDAAARVLEAVALLVRRRGVTVVIAEHRVGRVRPLATRVVDLPGRAAPAARGWCNAPADAPPTAPDDDAAPLLRLADVSAAHGARTIVRSANLSVTRGEVVLLTGPSGAGKTTLLRAALGLNALLAGEVTLDGRSLAKMSAREVFRLAAYLPQDPSSLLLADTVAAELALTLRHRPPSGAPPPTVTVLEDLGLAELAEAYPRHLSTGQRQRVALAAVAVGAPGLLVLDEPTRGLDDAATEGLRRFLRRRAAAGAAVLVASHDNRLRPAADRVLVLRDGVLAPAEEIDVAEGL